MNENLFSNRLSKTLYQFLLVTGIIAIVYLFYRWITENNSSISFRKK